MSECLVDRDINDGFESHTEKLIRTITQRTCIECGSTIDIGDLYWLFTGVAFNMRIGEYFYEQYRTCAPCKELRDRFCCNWIFGEVLSDIEEALEFEDLDLGCLDGLSKPAADRMISIIDHVLDMEE